MARCSFCSENVPEGRGKVFVKADGKIFHFCNSRCQKNWRLGRTGKKVRWTRTHLKDKGKA